MKAATLTAPIASSAGKSSIATFRTFGPVTSILRTRWRFACSGDDLVSLRYPLVVAGILQAALLFLLFQQRPAVVAAIASITLTALSFVQFLNPTAHWYCLFLAIAIICVLELDGAGGPLASWNLVGFLIVSLILFRQLSGVFVAIGALTYLLLELSQRPRRRTLGRLLLVVMGLGLGWYLFRTADLLPLLAFGLWPMAIIVRAWLVVGADDRRVAEMIGRLALGGMTAALPLVIYHVAHGSWGTWFDDTIFGSMALTNLDFIQRPSYFSYVVGGMSQLLAGQGFSSVVNGVFWMSLPLIPIALGYLTYRAIRGTSSGLLHPLPFNRGLLCARFRPLPDRDLPLLYRGPIACRTAVDDHRKWRAASAFRPSDGRQRDIGHRPPLSRCTTAFAWIARDTDRRAYRLGSECGNRSFQPADRSRRPRPLCLSDRSCPPGGRPGPNDVCCPREPGTLLSDASYKPIPVLQLGLRSMERAPVCDR